MENKPSTFGDNAFSVVFAYLTPLTWLAVVTMTLFWVLIGACFGALAPESGFSTFIAAIVLVFLASSIIGRFAAGARRGELSAGLVLNGSSLREALQFGLTHLALVIAWELPLLLIVFLIGGSLTFAASANAGGLTTILGLVVVFAALLGPTLATLPAACSGSLGEAFSLSLWRRIFVERFDDVLFFYVCLFGGLFVFAFIYLIPIAALALIAPSNFGAVETMLFRLSMWLPPLTGGTMPILLGRLAGVFAYSDQAAPSQKVSVGRALPSISTPVSAPPSAPSPARPQIKQSEKALSAEANEWLQANLKAESSIVAAYLFERLGNNDTYERKLGLELSPQAGMSDRQKLFLALSSKLAGSPLAADEIGITLLNDTTKVLAQRAGTVVYRR